MASSIPAKLPQERARLRAVARARAAERLELLQPLRQHAREFADGSAIEGEGIERCGHAAPKEIMDLYTTVEWKTVCRDVATLKLILAQARTATP